jgi:hypothetical protein
MKLPQDVVVEITEKASYRGYTAAELYEYLKNLEIPSESDNLLELLRSVQKIAKEAWDYWDGDEDMKVGKILKALAGRMPGYRVDIDKITGACTCENGSQTSADGFGTSG